MAEKWISYEQQPSPEGLLVDTKIDDEHGVRNRRPLIRDGNFFRTKERELYAFFRPTHWKYREQAIATADTVRHIPTGETWVVAYVDGNSLCACGWPETIAKLSDCKLVEKATEEQRFKLIQELAAMPGTECDTRRVWAKSYLMEAVV